MADGRKQSTGLAIEEETTIKVTPRKDVKDGIRPNGTIKLKRPFQKSINKPGNWRDGSIIDDDKKSRVSTANSPLSGTTTSPSEPVVNQLDDSVRDTFLTGRPVEDSPEMQLCKRCGKSFLKSSAKAHVETCLAGKNKKKKEKEKVKILEKDKDKEEKKDSKDKEKPVKAKEKKVVVVAEEDGEGEDDDDAEGDEGHPKKTTATVAGSIKSAKKSAAKKTDVDGDKKGRKRKADGDAEKAPKPKKKKEDPKPKAPKPKGPVDVERQCGVITPSGVPCARSLTCKSHPMGAKRSVPGRSLPYDMLLAAYQKKNQAKQQKAAIDANAPLEDEDDANAGPIDSDEETSAVMTALSRWNPRPVVDQPVLMPIRRLYQLARLREQLDNATNGGTVNIFKVVSKNGEPLKDVNLNVQSNGLDGEDAPGEPDFGVGSSMIMGGGASRKSSSASAIQPPSTASQAQRKASVVSNR